MCGIIGVAKIQENGVYDIYDGLVLLQHRGQDSAGIVTFNGTKFFEKRGPGLIRDIFTNLDMKRLKGNFGLGHCRYTTCGNFDNLEETQPFFVNSPFGIYMIHNGNLTNTDKLREEIQKKYHRHLRTDSDTEILLNMFAQKIREIIKRNRQQKDLKKILFDATKKIMEQVSGSYSIITIVDEIGMLIFRDPNGIRPLVIGTKKTTQGQEWCFASEDVAFRSQGYELYRDVRPGEAILIDKKGKFFSHQCVKGELHPCIFEYIYLARPDSLMNNISVHKARIRMGNFLAKQIKKSGLSIDSVMPIPDSGRTLAVQIAQELGIKYREGLVKNRYIGRTFIMPNQRMRQKSIRQKLNPIDLEFRGRNILLVDDSIVRGNTIKQIIQLCRNAGAKRVYIAIGAPPVRYPDVYGIDIPTRRELIAHNASIKEIQKAINADALFYQKLEDLISSARIGNPSIKKFHTAFFDGKYITPEVTPSYLKKLEEKIIMQNKNESALEFPTF